MPKTEQPATLQSNSVIVIAIVFILVIILRHAWMSDDAYITLRTIDHWVNGHGLVYNVGERVQSYTHPLWMLLLSLPYFFTHETFFTVITVSILLVITGLYIFATRIASSVTVSLMGILGLSLSKSFIDYTTSGLENPLTYFLLIVYLGLYLKGKLSNREHLWLSILCALGILNRLDLGLLFLPPLLYSLFNAFSWRRIYLTTLGFIPIVLWELFSLFYYGFLFPNTAYAKLNTGIPQAELWQQGFSYFINSLERDPITLTVIGAAMVISILSKDWRKIILASGMVLYLMYILRIGGDFMGGRFFSAPLLIAVLVLCHFDWQQITLPVGVAIAALAVGIGLSAPYPTWLIPNNPIPRAEILDRRGITDERAYYNDNTLMQVRRIGDKVLGGSTRINGLRAQYEAKAVDVVSTIGRRGFYAGPHVYIIDKLALSDPLLARIPARYDRAWVTGHYRREIPPGYAETIETGVNQIQDPKLAEYYDKLSNIVRGDLLDIARINDIWRMNTGHYDHLIIHDRYRYARAQSIPLADMAQRPGHAAHWLTEGIIVVSDKSLLLTLDGTISHAAGLEISVASHNQYRIVYRQNGQEIAEQTIRATHFPPAALYTHRLTIPDKARQAGFDSIRILPVWAPKELDGISNAAELAGVDEVDIFIVGRVALSK